MQHAHNTHIFTRSNNTTRQQRRLTWVMTLCPLPLYLDHIFMYFYFLGSPTGDSQNGVSGVDFTEHGFLSNRGCSQPIFHGWSKQEPSEWGSGDRCSLEDSKIHKKETERKKNTDNGPHLSCEQHLSWTTEYIINQCFQWCRLFSHHHEVQPLINVFFYCLTIILHISPSISFIFYQQHRLLAKYLPFSNAFAVANYFNALYALLLGFS